MASDGITLSHIRFSYRKNGEKVFDDLSLSFPKGKISVVLGPSGCGKSTLLRLIAGTKEGEGDVFFDGVDAKDTAIEERPLSYASQDIALFPHMTIFENIAFPLQMRHVSREETNERVASISKRLRIAHCLPVKGKYLSIGQQKRAMIARELVSEPRYLLLDEPFTSLDAPLRKELGTLIKELQSEQGTTIVYVTHSYVEAMSLADVLFIFDEGKLVAEGTPYDLSASHNPYLDVLSKAELLNGEDLR